MIIINVRSTGNTLYFIIAVIITNICIISLIKTAVIFRIHITAAAPRLVTDAEVVDFPRFFTAVLLSKLSHWRNAVKCHIFNPFVHFLNRTGTYIAINVCVTAELTAKFKIFMSAKRIILNNTAPVGINHFLSIFLRANTILPMIFVCKAAARPAKYRNMNLLKRFNYVISHSVCVWNRRIFSYVKTLINAASKMLSKVAVNILINLADFMIWVN